MNDQKQKIRDFLRLHVHGVIATTDGSTPEAALVGFSETDDLEVIFGTFNDSRKYRNLGQNSTLAFVVSGDEITVQYEGVGREVVGEEGRACAAIHVTKIPSSAKYGLDPRQRYFKVSPRWIRFTNYSAGAEEVFELTF